jgi:hypothetical protein
VQAISLRKECVKREGVGEKKKGVRRGEKNNKNADRK